MVYTDKSSGQSVTVEAKTIIVASGTIESAKLLQRSTSTYWPHGIGNDNDLVGRFFITHPYFIFSGFIPSNNLKLQPEMNFPTLVSRQFDSEAEQKKGKFVLVNPPDTVPVALAAKMQAGFSRAEIDKYATGRLPLQFTAWWKSLGAMKTVYKTCQGETISVYPKRVWTFPRTKASRIG